MSLTSYRAAPPRVMGDCFAPIWAPGFRLGGWGIGEEREVLVIGLLWLLVCIGYWSGGDLLSHVLRRSTIGATELNGRVRDGIGCFPRAVTTRPRKRMRRIRFLGLIFLPVIFLPVIKAAGDFSAPAPAPPPRPTTNGTGA